MKKVLVVGGAGYIGGALTDFLMDDDDISFTVYDSLVYEDLYLKPVDLIVGDVRDTEKLGSIINDYDTVVWLAAIVGDGACAVNPELTVSVNEDSVRWLNENYKGKIIFMSTCSVYGANNDHNLNELAPTNPLSLYAGTKINCEKILKDRDNAVMFRLGTVHGIGDTYSRIRMDLVVNVLSMRASLGEPLTVFGGEQWRPIIHVRDVANALYHAVKAENGWETLRGVYNLTYKNVTIKDIADDVSKIIPDCKVKYVDKKFEDLRNYHVTSNKLFSVVDWKPEITVESTVEELKDLFTSGRIRNVNNSVYSNEKYIKELNR